jgi:hypothetical protein
MQGFVFDREAINLQLERLLQVTQSEQGKRTHNSQTSGLQEVIASPRLGGSIIDARGKVPSRIDSLERAFYMVSPTIVSNFDFAPKNIHREANRNSSRTAAVVARVGKRDAHRTGPIIVNPIPAVSAGRIVENELTVRRLYVDATRTCHDTI